MDISIIIVNYNSYELTCNCIRSVIKMTTLSGYEIILVDNASTECEPEKFLVEFSGIKLIKSSKNGGFAYGNNLGIEKASGEYILLLNSDTVLRDDSITKSFQKIKAEPSIGVLGCRMIFPDGALQYTARRFRSIGWELLDLFRFLPYMLPYKKRANLMLGKYFRHDEDKDCDWVNGAFFFLPVSLIQELPAMKLDERFFMYGEDQLWCEQARAHGYRILFFAGTTIIHINSGSTSRDKQLQLRKTMMKHELEIMKLRKGSGLYYTIFKLIYSSKEITRNFIKSIFFRSTGRMIR